MVGTLSLPPAITATGMKKTNPAEDDIQLADAHYRDMLNVMDPADFGRHVKAMRRVRRMTQEDLAAASCLSPDSIRRLERGTFSPSLKTLHRLCEGLRLRIDTLFSSYYEIEDGSRTPAEIAAREDVLRLDSVALRAALDVARMVSGGTPSGDK